MRRRTFIQRALWAAGGLLMTQPSRAAERMPVLFIGHGSPMNAIQDNPFTRDLRQAGAALPRPRAILVLSAHWLTRDRTAVLGTERPETIYDFGGFDRALYEIVYPAPGAPEPAGATVEMLRDQSPVEIDGNRGLDHGAWSVLRHLFPEAEVPVYQLSLDFSQPPRFHYEIGRALRPLRERGVLVIGSGNIVHNLGRLDWDDPVAAPDAWARAFDEAVAENLLLGGGTPVADRGRAKVPDPDAALIDWPRLPHAATAHPTYDHYIPLLYTVALREPEEPLRFVHEGYQHANISMRSFRIG